MRPTILIAALAAATLAGCASSKYAVQPDEGSKGDVIIKGVRYISILNTGHWRFYKTPEETIMALAQLNAESQNALVAKDTEIAALKAFKPACPAALTIPESATLVGVETPMSSPVDTSKIETK